MLIASNQDSVVVSCGDTSTTVVANLTTGHAVFLYEEDWDLNWTPLRWSHMFSGYLPETVMRSLRDRSESSIADYLYGLAHDCECEPKSFQDLMDFHLDLVA